MLIESRMDAPDYLDDDGYPTDAALQRLAEWPQADVNGAIDFMRLLWWGGMYREIFTPEERAVYHLRDDRRYVSLSTGGWSGNEDLMRSFRERWWREHAVLVERRGGHYVLEYPPE